MIIDARDAEPILDELFEAAIRGEEVIITDGPGKAVRLTPLSAAPDAEQPG